MDLISREAVANYVDNMPSELTEDGRRMIRGIRIKEFIADCPSAFEGMTYGEVIKAIFGIKDEQIDEAKYLISISPKGNHHDPFMAVKREVWNRPYKELSVIFNTVGGE